MHKTTETKNNNIEVINMKGSIRKRGKYYSYSFDIGKDENGKRRRKTKSGFNTKAEAEKALALAVAEFENTGRTITTTKLSVAEYMNMWYENYVLINCKYRTQVEYKRIINSDINPILGNYHLRNLTPRTIKDFLDYHYKRGISKKTLETIFSVLKYSLDMAVFPEEIIKDNPARMIKLKYKFKKTEGNRISYNDAITTLNYLKANYYNYYIPFFIMFHTGIRKSECLGLQWENIDFNNNIIQIRHQALYKDGEMILVDTKTPSSVADILIGDTLINTLKDYKKVINSKNLKHNFVCVNTNYDPMSLPNFSWIVRKIKKDLGISIKAHGFRHLHGQMLLDNDANIKGIQARLRHANVQTTLQTYLKSSDKIEKNTLDLWEDLF